ncbi:MAG: oxidoreductase [Gammaproteobacteria bacterium RIFCSPHIGHO2_12_FULL_63_22]|nr:MAG: oxidoreductase [Gammaproteobacteria bacterium RIFCSPHIGHO2_12_FULL_63_22]
MDRFTTPFGFNSTAMDVVRGVDLSGKRAIVTGGATGIGVETSRALAFAGAEVTMAVRRVDEADVVATQLRESTGNPSIFVRELDLVDLDSVADLAAEWQGPLHILVNNAGIMALPELERTSEGWEMQFATNFLGHFALTLGLYEALAAADGARVVSVSSSAHARGPVFFDDPHFNFIPYDPWLAYAQSKTANVLMSVELTHRWSGVGILSNALNPGAIPTNLQKHIGGMKTPVNLRKTPQQGAATSVLLAASPLLDGIGGRYFENCIEAGLLEARPGDFSGGVAPYALDPENSRRLWRMASELISASPPLA